MPNNIISFLKETNKNLDVFLSHLLSSYLPSQNVPYFTSYILLLIKVVILMILLLVPVIILKLLKSDSSFLTMLILLILFVVALALFGIFIGFFQILYS